LVLVCMVIEIILGTASQNIAISQNNSKEPEDDSFRRQKGKVGL
jgi:hypothetical protein